MVLYSQERGYLLLYDYAATVKLARKDEWGPSHAKGCPYRYVDGKLRGCKCDVRTLKPGERAARAARQDYERLRAWCRQDWGYIGVIVRDVKTGEHASLWGIESDGDYWREVAVELADEVLYTLRETRRKAEIRHCLLGEAP
jgi:hypothetical protein